MAQQDGSSDRPAPVIDPAFARTLEPEPTPKGPDSTLPADRNWERYELLEQLGQGGMGTVYRARDRKLGRLVALKFIRSEDPQMTARFMQEARAQSAVDHPGICKVFEVGEVQGKPFIAMQLVDGISLHYAGRSMALLDKLQIIKDTAEAVHAAHMLGIIHRDLKPANIMVERTPTVQDSADGMHFRPVVMDFGLAREASDSKGLTESGAVLGTPAYMSPEQARGDVRHLDQRTDVYSLGATLYDILSGAPPFEDQTVVNLILKVLNDEIPPLRRKQPELPEAVETIVSKCLNKEPDQRYQTAQELADDLGRFLSNQRIIGRKVSLWYRVRYRARRNKVLTALAASLLASLLAFLVYGVRAKVIASREAARARHQAELSRELGQEVKDLEWLMRAAYSMPLCDVEGQRAQVRSRMEALAARVRGEGAEAAGLAHYGLGRGHLALHEYEQAYQHLEQALALGLRIPELHYALGRVQGELYSQALDEARRSGDKSWLARRQAELEKQYLAKALLHLQESQRLGLKTESPSYLAGLIAFYNRKLDEALSEALKASAQSPWMYEATKLQGDVYFTRMSEQQLHGDYEAARKNQEQAQRLYERTAELGRSDAQVYLQMAEVWQQQAQLDRAQGRPMAPALEQVIRIANQAITAAPTSSGGYTKQVFANFWLGWQALGRNEDPRPLFQKAMIAGERAVERNPRDAYAYELLGNAYSGLAKYEIVKNLNPSTSIQKAISSFSQALRIEPRFPWAWNDLGLVYGTKREQVGGSFLEQKAAIDRELECFVKASALDPDYLAAYVNRIKALYSLAYLEVSSGRDPHATVDAASKVFAAGVTVNKNYAWLYTFLAMAQLELARYELASGRDPAASADRAMATALSASKLRPSSVDQQVAADALFIKAAYRSSRGEDPSALLGEAARFLAACQKLSGDGMPECNIIEVKSMLLAAEWEQRRGARPLPRLGEAVSAARRASERYPESGALSMYVAQALWRRAEVEPAGPAQLDVTQGLASVDRTLRQDASTAEAHAVRACLLLLQAQAAGAATENRLAKVAAAQQEFARAVALNSLLQQQYAPQIKKAVALQASLTQGSGNKPQ